MSQFSEFEVRCLKVPSWFATLVEVPTISRTRKEAVIFMTIEELRKLCNQELLEIDKILTDEQWDAVNTYIDTLDETSAREIYNRLREHVLQLLECDDQLSRSKYAASLPLATRGIAIWFARVAASQAGTVASAIEDALDQPEGFENPVRTLAERIEREDSAKSFLGLF